MLSMIVHIVSTSKTQTLCGEPRTVMEEIPEVPVCRKCVEVLLKSEHYPTRHIDPRIDRAVAA